MKYKVLVGFNYCTKPDQKKRAGGERVDETRCDPGTTVTDTKLKAAGVLKQLVAAGAIVEAD